jgi:HD-GYP domain-containing protein (c-di-GMP phosphodiesterase class II)
LNDAQWEIMKQHPVIGERIVARIPGLESVAQAIRHEHERWDGKGYPDGLKGDSIPLASRIVLVCDAFHAMTSDRPYREAMPVEDARAELVRHAGTQFDPVIVGALLSSLDLQSGNGAAPIDPTAAKLIDGKFEPSSALQSV